MLASRKCKKIMDEHSNIVILRKKLAKLEKALKIKERELDLLNNIAGILNRSGNLSGLLSKTLGLMHEQYQYNFGLFFFAVNCKHLGLEASSGEIENPVLDKILITAEDIYNNSEGKNSYGWCNVEGYTCVIIIITGKQGKLGILCLGWNKLNILENKPEILKQMLLICTQLGMAIGNLELYEETRHKSITDALTGLYNRHYFNECIQKWRSHTDDQGLLSLILIDLNDFKHINDTYGHLVGDEVLKVMAKIIRDNIRKNDFAARYGGDEFIVVMPHTPEDKAEIVRQRLWKAVLNWNHTEASQKLLRGELLLFSAGVKTSAPHNIDLLLKQADQEMYKEKEQLNQQMLKKIVTQAEQDRQKYAVQAALSLAKTVEIKDSYLRGHSARVQEYAELIAQSMGIAGPMLEDIKLAATLHDIGKIGLPLSILHKTERLDDEEMNICRQHPVIGENIIIDLDVMVNVTPMIRHHHERFDGKKDGKYPGYPDGLRREEIPVGARIIAVADAFDAMISNRPYRKSLDFSEAVSELTNQAGRQFDPEVVKAFIRVIKDPVLCLLSAGKIAFDKEKHAANNTELHKIINNVTQMKKTE